MNISGYYEVSQFQSIRELTGHNTIGGYIKFSGINWLPLKDKASQIALFTDSFIKKSIIKDTHDAFKVAIALEPIEINPTIIDDLLSCSKYLDLILTHDETILKLFPKARPYIPGGTLFQNGDKLISSPKKRKLSIVASSKNTTIGHKLRHEVIKRFANTYEIDVFGEGYSPFDNRGEPYGEYDYTIVIENVKYESNHFTEKFIDPVLLKCVPIYWGTADIGRYFNIAGIREFSSLTELEKILCRIKGDQDTIDSEVLSSNQYTATNFMSKEWNIQKVLEKELNKTELPTLASKMLNLENFLSGEKSFIDVEPQEFLQSGYRAISDIGCSRRTSYSQRIQDKILLLGKKYGQLRSY